EGSEDRKAVVAVGPAPVRGAPREAKAVPGERKTGEGGQHVAGIREQRERSGKQAARGFGDQKHAGQRSHDADAPLARPVQMFCRAGRMVMVMMTGHQPDIEAWRVRANRRSKKPAGAVERRRASLRDLALRKISRGNSRAK